MKRTLAWFAVVSWILSVPIFASAEDKKEVSATEKTAGSPLLAALREREALAAAIMAGDEEAEAVFGRLRANPAPMGLALDHDTEYALALVEIGQRLSAADHPKAAEAFFREGEQALGEALLSLRVEDVHGRFMVLRKRAQVRSSHLGKGREAQADFAEALLLKPGDKTIARQRDLLLSAYGELTRVPIPRPNQN
jgi:hypothetical protein